jgi:hypothetical protein
MGVLITGLSIMGLHAPTKVPSCIYSFVVCCCCLLLLFVVVVALFLLFNSNFAADTRLHQRVLVAMWLFGNLGGYSHAYSRSFSLSLSLDLSLSLSLSLSAVLPCVLVMTPVPRIGIRLAPVQCASWWPVCVVRGF